MLFYTHVSFSLTNFIAVLQNSLCQTSPCWILTIKYAACSLFTEPSLQIKIFKGKLKLHVSPQVALVTRILSSKWANIYFFFMCCFHTQSFDNSISSDLPLNCWLTNLTNKLNESAHFSTNLLENLVREKKIFPIISTSLYAIFLKCSRIISF